MKLLIANLLHRIEQWCVVRRLALNVKSCPGCACGWPTKEEKAYVKHRYVTWRSHTMPIGIQMDCNLS